MNSLRVHCAASTRIRSNPVIVKRIHPNLQRFQSSTCRECKGVLLQPKKLFHSWSRARMASAVSIPRRTASTLSKTLNKAQDKLLQKELDILRNLKQLMKEVSASKEEIEHINKSIQQLEDLFLLVVVGEFNSGKSSFLNALLGKKFLIEGVTPTTSRIGILKHGDSRSTALLQDDTDVEQITVPVDWLKDISLVDTPGTNAVFRGHQQLTEHFVPRSDLVLFVTCADRAFSESERQFLSSIQQWKKKVVVVLSKIDIVESEKELNEILQFVKSNFTSLLGMEPVIFPVSSKMALKAKLQVGSETEKLNDNPYWKESKFGELEHYILETVIKEEQALLKMENPIGVGEHLASKFVEGIQERQKVLQGDIKTLKNIHAQIEEFKKEMYRDFALQNDKVDNILLLMRNRGVAFLEKKLTFGNLLELIRSEKLRIDFEHEVVGETSRAIEKQVDSLIDWTLLKNSRLWNDVMNYLQERASLGSKEIMGKITTNFDYDRVNLLKVIGEDVGGIVSKLNKEDESQRLASEVRAALVSTAAVEVGALGIGGLLAASLVDFSGVLGASALAATGLAIIPYKRSTMKAAFETKVDELREKLKASLKAHFEHEVDTALHKLEDAITPYSRFVKTEDEKLANMLHNFKQTIADLNSLRQELAKEFGQKRPAKASS